jgi:hypothetical protein
VSLPKVEKSETRLQGLVLRRSGDEVHTRYGVFSSAIPNVEEVLLKTAKTTALESFEYERRLSDGKGAISII